ncbi:TetR/AcrR family transcriptional regulator [Virgibacillus sp. MSP4-1]|uniref:TetR/AcrR family transcriptional regulator n=1 Tax=Virgibacillus sp. MSP4-1 TaxID=2700081 RepID=UPI001EE3EC88|nr:TetR/AcrR family transcriptional regulator [Virgibacillus sp. MSP4-1]
MTFFNLPDYKRKKLIDAAEKEFARVALFEASIANIVKTAGIPRGSFYQYFQDKEDLYFYLLDKKLDESKRYFVSILDYHNGDIFEAMVDMYHQFLVMMPDEEEHNFIKNALLYATNKVENSFTSIFDSTYDNNHYYKVIESIDRDNLKVKEDEDLLSVLQVMSAVAFHNIIVKLSNKLSDDEATEQFKVQMELLKHGVYQET